VHSSFVKARNFLERLTTMDLSGKAKYHENGWLAN
jgi:hypothetical protein